MRQLATKKKSKKLISLCIPVLNEIENLESLYIQLCLLSSSLKKYNFEFVFSDNSSIDGTWDWLKNASNSDNRIRGIRFSRNIGYQNSIMRNYDFAEGDALIQLDADLQDPIEVITEFISNWEKGYKIVYGIREKRSESPISNFVRKIGYVVLNWASDSKLHKDVGDFRLIDREVIELIKKRNYRNPYIRGIVSSFGFKEIGVRYTRKLRVHGESKFSPIGVIRLGLVGLFSFSTKPIRVFIPIAIISSFTAILGILWILYLYLTDNNLPPGFSTTQVILFVTMAINTSFFAIAGDYLLKIYFALLPSVDGYIAEQF
jgi:dolichol-phosphate mannosyltransferase